MSGIPRRPARCRPPLRGRAAAARPCLQPPSALEKGRCPQLRRLPRRALVPARKFTMPQAVDTGGGSTPQDGNGRGCSMVVLAAIVLALLLVLLMLGP